MSLYKKFILCNSGFLVVFIAAYSMNRNLMILAALIPTLFIFFVKEQSFGTAELIFLLPFSATMTISIGTTSLFMLPKLAFVILCFSTNKLKINRKILNALILFFLYLVALNFFKGGLPLVRIVNMIFGLLVAYLIVQSLRDSNGMVAACKLFVSGVLISGVIGLLKNIFPNLSNELIEAHYLNELSGNITQRFAGLWGDPNGYTIFLICALFSTLWLFKNEKIKVIVFSFITVSLSVFGILTLSKSCALLLLGFWGYFLLSNQGISAVKKIIAGAFVGFMCIWGASFYTNELTELIYRFTSARVAGGRFNLTELTTYRSVIWTNYLSEILNGDFLFGFGINAPLVGGLGCHNTYLQLIYNLGITGTIGYIIVWRLVLVLVKTKCDIVPVLFLLITIFFVGCVYNEYLYFLFPFMFLVGGRIQVEEKERNIL